MVRAEMNTDLPEERAFLTAWDCLSRYHDDWVLAGDLAIKYLTHPPDEGFPGPVTLDVNFGIHLGARARCVISLPDPEYLIAQPSKRPARL